MPEQALTIKDVIGLCADMMSLFGFTGFFTWSFVRKSLDSVGSADIGVSVFALSVKAFIALAILLLLSIPAFFCHMFVVLLISGSLVSGDGLWNESKQLAYIVSYIVTSLWFIPLAILLISSVFAWSLEPFRRFSHAFTGKKFLTDS